MLPPFHIAFDVVETEITDRLICDPREVRNDYIFNGLETIDLSGVEDVGETTRLFVALCGEESCDDQHGGQVVSGDSPRIFSVHWRTSNLYDYHTIILRFSSVVKCQLAFNPAEDWEAGLSTKFVIPRQSC